MIRRFCASAVARASPGLSVVRSPSMQVASAQPELHDNHRYLSPRNIVEMLDRHIVGQAAAKRAIAIALRNRWRRRQLGGELGAKTKPKHILMVGPTGVGKTEIARSMASFLQVPFIKVEATRFSEVGFQGSDVETIIKDLMEISLTVTRRRLMEQSKEQFKLHAEDRVIGALGIAKTPELLQSLRAGELDSTFVVVELGGGMRRGMSVRDALPQMEQEAFAKLYPLETLLRLSRQSVEQEGIVVIDEIDKIVRPRERSHAQDASDEGVQRDLLPLLDGAAVSTKHGVVNTDHILFIASGAFHKCKPADLISELQGRLPIRVELHGLGREELLRVLIEPEHSIINQHAALLRTEGVDLSFTSQALDVVASVAASMNQTVEDIGARRLHTIMELVMEDISFNAPDLEESTVQVTAEMVTEKLQHLNSVQSYQRFVL